jgi:tripartite-type tricarboxylate transporter receptor subunit TctC
MANKLAATTGFLLLAALAAPAHAAPATDTFAGKTVTIVSGGGPGAGFTFAARLLAQHMSRHIPGRPTIVVQAMPGGGGVKMMAYMYNVAPKDGLHLGAVLPPSIAAALLRDVKYAPDKFYWLGSISPLTVVSTVWHTSPAKTIAEARTHDVLMAAANKSADSYVIPAFLNAVAGTKFKIVQGYAGGDAMDLAMERGEVNGRTGFYNNYLTTKPDWLREHKIIQLVQVGARIKELPDVPSLGDLAPNAEMKQVARIMEIGPGVGHGFFLPPRTPSAVAATLRQAFRATMKDAQFLADAEKRHQPVDPVTGEEIQKLVTAAAGTPPAPVGEFKRLIGLD